MFRIVSIIISILFLLSGCVKERYIGQYVSTTIPVIEFTNNSGAGTLSLISNKGDKNTGFNVACSLNNISNNIYNIHANVTPIFTMDRYLQITFHLILLNSGSRSRRYRPA